MTDVTVLPDKDLDLAIGAAFLDGDKARLKALEDEHDRRRREEARERLAEAERARRAHDSADTDRRMLLAKLTALRDDYRAQFLDRLNEIDTASNKAALISAAHELGMQAHSLSHDLVGVTGDRRFSIRYDVSDLLLGHGGRLAEAFLTGMRGRRVVVPQPWADDVRRLRELTPDTTGIANGG
jgi:hypothetical protein